MRKWLRAALIGAALAAVGVAGTAGAARFITGKDIRNGSIGLVDLSRSARKSLQGRAGPAGPQGPAGAQGAPGPSSLATTVLSQLFDVAPSSFGDAEVRCPGGMVATGGSLSSGALIPVFDAPSDDGGGWQATAYNTDSSTTYRMAITVVCTPGSAQVILSTGRRAPDGAQIDALKAQVLAAHGG
ncbi:MAG TPA: hypothetical protein VFU94_07085 [Conexibacter sp.]|nr:hypothetical protein [Conexibacter sp.]